MNKSVKRTADNMALLTFAENAWIKICSLAKRHPTIEWHDVVPVSLLVITGVLVFMLPVGDRPRKPASGRARQPADTAVQPNNVVVVAPSAQHKSYVAYRCKQLLIDVFVEQTTIEAFDEAVLLTLVRHNAMPLDATILRPLQDRHAGQPGSVVANDYKRLCVAYR